MRVRELQSKDAEFMLEWMHDPDIVKDLRADFATKTIDNCEQFIMAAQDHSDSINLAIVNDEDEYMGTVSLKHIKHSTAEFGITVRRCALGKGYSQFGMKSIIKRGFEDLGLKEIYWCVSPNNLRAIRFYDKQSFKRTVPNDLSEEFYTVKERDSYIWYSIVCHDEALNGIL